MSDSSLTHQTPHGALLNLPEQPGGLYRAVVMRGGVAHEVVALREEGSEVLVSSATFYGWVALADVIREAD